MSPGAAPIRDRCAALMERTYRRPPLFRPGRARVCHGAAGMRLGSVAPPGPPASVTHALTPYPAAARLERVNWDTLPRSAREARVNTGHFSRKAPVRRSSGTRTRTRTALTGPDT